MTKLLFLIAIFFFHDPNTGELVANNDIIQVTSGTCEEAEHKYLQHLTEIGEQLGITEVYYSCGLVDVDPSKNQNGSI